MIAAVYALAILPAVVVIEIGAALNRLCLFGLLLSLSATVLQAVSNLQPHRFQKRESGGFIREGFGSTRGIRTISVRS